MVQQQQQPKAGWAGDDADDADFLLLQQQQAGWAGKNYY